MKKTAGYISWPQNVDSSWETVDKISAILSEPTIALNSTNDRLFYSFDDCLLCENCLVLYKYILLVRVICEKYRLRGEANIPSCRIFNSK